MTGCATSKKTTSASVASNQDGSSFEKAIVVKNIDEEYAYVKKVCPDCKFKKQSLVSQGKKYYDVLLYDNSGTEAAYYFDINSFFGKLF
jgi:glutaredoxin